jgi:tRNA_anti-like
MAKQCPSCGYGPIGPFSDNCPICAETVRHVRSRGGNCGSGPAWLSNIKPALRWVLIAALVAVVSIGGCCGVQMWQVGMAVRDMQKDMEEAQAAIEADRKARTVVVSAADFLREFQTDADTADRKYTGKYLELTGVVERVGQRANETPFVILDAGDENARLKIECFFDFVDQFAENRVKQLPKGRTITLCGEYDGQVSNVQLRDCVLVE